RERSACLRADAQRQLDIAVVAVEAGDVEAHSAIEQLGLQPDFPGFERFRAETDDLLRIEWSRVDAAAFKAGRPLPVNRNVRRDFEHRIEAIIDAVAVIDSRYPIERTELRVGSASERFARVGV